MYHQWRLRRNYQFPNAALTIQDGDGTQFFGWAVNVQLRPATLYGVVRYTVDYDRVAWVESKEDFCEDVAGAEAWIRQTIKELKEAQLKKLITEALYVGGAHHKQWYFWKIAEILSIDLSDQWSEEYPEPDRGIAP